MNLSSLFSFGSITEKATVVDIPVLFPLSVNEKVFIETEIRAIYHKILTDVAERTQGLEAGQESKLWDNCLESESSDGLITMLTKAMFEKGDLFLVLDKASDVLRRATGEEQQIIRADYKKKAASATGTYISFKNFQRTDMLKLYAALDYCTIGALNKTMNIAKSVQIKVKDLRSNVSLADASVAIEQVQAIADALKAGRDTYMDQGDELVTADPKIDPTKASMELLNQKKAFYLGLPASYITGELNSGLGDSGQADARAVDRGLKIYFVSIFKPVCKALFNKEVSFKSEDFAQLSTNLEALKTFELVSDELISKENKLDVINKLFGFPEGTTGDEPEEVTVPQLPAPAADPKDNPRNEAV